MISDICEGFECVPDEAERQDWYLVQDIFEYRRARYAVELFNSKDGTKELAKHPALVTLLRDIHEAQGDEGITDAEVMAEATARGERAAQEEAGEAKDGNGG